MAIEKTLNTRLQLKYDSYANWTSTSLGEDKGANFVLKAGEIGICYLPTSSNEQQVVGSQPPQILFKVGDGSSKYSALPWASAKSADVYTWAKQANLPVTKEGNGNVVASISWDETTNGIKFTTASVATSEGMEQLIERVVSIENTYATDDDLAQAIQTVNQAIELKANKSYVDEVSQVANAAATQIALAEEIARAKAAEKANADAITVLAEGIDPEKVDSVKDLIDYVDNHGAEVTGMKADIAANTGAITVQNAKIDDEVERLENLIDEHAERISSNENLLETLNIENGKVANAKQADASTDANKLGGVESSRYLLKTDATGYDNILTKTEAAGAYQPKGNYATSAQGEKADTALQQITTTANGGLVVTGTNKVDIDTNVIFVFNCGDSTTVI